jgi:hypothetical protein
MTGREAPSVHELRDNLQKRVDGIHMGFAAGTSSHSKRYIVRPAGSPKGESLLEASTKDYSSTGRFKPNVEKAQVAGAAGQSKAAGKFLTCVISEEMLINLYEQLRMLKEPLARRQQAGLRQQLVRVLARLTFKLLRKVV